MLTVLDIGRVKNMGQSQVASKHGSSETRPWTGTWSSKERPWVLPENLFHRAFSPFFIIFPSSEGWRYVAIYLVPFKHLNIYQYCYISDWIKLNNAIIMDDSLWSLLFISLLSLGLKFDWHWHAMPKLSTAQFVWQPRKLKTRDVLLVSFIHQIGPWWNHPVSANPCVW